MGKYIEIDTNNNPEVIQCIVETIPYMQGWTMAGNVITNYTNPSNHWFKSRNSTPRFFAFDLNFKEFIWASEDDQPISTAISIRSLAQISKLLEDINNEESGITSHGESYGVD